MITRSVLTVLLLAAWSSLAVANGSEDRDKGEEVTRTVSKTYTVEYADKRVETFLVKYDGIVRRHMWQEGKSSKLAEGHPIDDRRCRWTLASKVRKQVFLVSHSGMQASFDAAEQIFQMVHSGGRGPTSAIEIFYHKTCGDVQDTYAKELAAEKTALSKHFDDVVRVDSEKTAEQLKALVKAVKVSAK